MEPQEEFAAVVNYCNQYINEKRTAAEEIGQKIQALVSAGVSNNDAALRSLDKQLLGVNKDVKQLLEAKAKLLNPTGRRR